MGKGKILSNSGGGLYQVEIQMDFTRLDADIAYLQDRIVALDYGITEATNEEAVLRVAYHLGIALKQTALQSGNQEAIREAIKELVTLEANYSAAASKTEQLKLNKASAQSRLKYLQGFDRTLPTRSCTCCDFTDTLPINTFVGTIEIPQGARPGDTNTLVLIRPGYSGTPTWQASDGIYQPSIASQSAVAWFLREAIFPGWAKFNPTFRRGTVETINDQDHMRVKLDDDVVYCRTTNQAFLIDAPEDRTLANVLVDYRGTEDSAAFAVGDYCVVGYTDQSRSYPKVIGKIIQKKYIYFAREKGSGVTYGIYDDGHYTQIFPGFQIWIPNIKKEPVTRFEGGYLIAFSITIAGRSHKITYKGPSESAYSRTGASKHFYYQGRAVYSMPSDILGVAGFGTNTYCFCRGGLYRITSFTEATIAYELVLSLPAADNFWSIRGNLAWYASDTTMYCVKFDTTPVMYSAERTLTYPIVAGGEWQDVENKCASAPTAGVSNADITLIKRYPPQSMTVSLGQVSDGGTNIAHCVSLFKSILHINHQRYQDPNGMRGLWGQDIITIHAKYDRFTFSGESLSKVTYETQIAQQITKEELSVHREINGVCTTISEKYDLQNGTSSVHLFPFGKIEDVPGTRRIYGNDGQTNAISFPANPCGTTTASTSTSFSPGDGLVSLPWDTIATAEKRRYWTGSDGCGELLPSVSPAFPDTTEYEYFVYT
ncbi:MAG: hypothetical protein HQL56_01200 [Magnetococcales bacterium]|nr:hypothetical protein [Magnetococcales bacterium]